GREGRIECVRGVAWNDFVVAVLRPGTAGVVVCPLDVRPRRCRGPVVMDCVDDLHADLFASLCRGTVANHVQERHCTCLDYNCPGSLHLGDERLDFILSGLRRRLDVCRFSGMKQERRMKPGLLPIIESEQLLKCTTSRCPVCQASCPAEVWRVAGRPAKVFLKRNCPQHGEASVCIASDARFYWLAKGKSENACCSAGGASVLASRASVSGTNGSAVASLRQNTCCSVAGSTVGTLGRNTAGRGNGPFETLSTCLALIKIVSSCNLSCPTCYADSPPGTGHKVDAVPLEELQQRIQGVVD